MYINDKSIEEICCLAAVRVGHVLLCYDSQKSFRPVEYQVESVLLLGRQADLCVLKADRPTELIGLH